MFIEISVEVLPRFSQNYRGISCWDLDHSFSEFGFQIFGFLQITKPLIRFLNLFQNLDRFTSTPRTLPRLERILSWKSWSRSIKYLLCGDKISWQFEGITFLTCIYFLLSFGKLCQRHCKLGRIQSAKSDSWKFYGVSHQLLELILPRYRENLTESQWSRLLTKSPGKVIKITWTCLR